MTEKAKFWSLLVEATVLVPAKGQGSGWSRDIMKGGFRCKRWITVGTNRRGSKNV